MPDILFFVTDEASSPPGVARVDSLDPVPHLNEVLKVRAFLHHVGESAAKKDEQLRESLSKNEHLERESIALRRKLEQRSRELERTRRDYQTELKERGQKIGDLTDRFLADKFSVQLDELRTLIAAQYEDRIDRLQSTIAKIEISTDHVKQETQDEIACIKAAASEDLETLRHQHEVDSDELTRQLEQARDEESTARELRNRESEASSAEQEKLFERTEMTLQSLGEENERIRGARVSDLEEARSSAVAPHLERIAMLEQTLAEKDQLIANANDTLDSIQAATDKARQTAASDVDTIREESESRRETYEGQINEIRNECEELAAYVETMEKAVRDSEDTQRMVDLETNSKEFSRQLREREEYCSRLEAALAIVRQVCDRSAAARSIIGAEVNLETLFEAIE